jgi:hypothetical protein
MIDVALNNFATGSILFNRGAKIWRSVQSFCNEHLQICLKTNDFNDL